MLVNITLVSCLNVPACFGTKTMFWLEYTIYVGIQTWCVTNPKSLHSFLPNTSAIRQKGKFQNGCFKKTKHVNSSEKRTFLTPWCAHVRVRIRAYVCVSGGKKCSFFGKFDVLCFLETPVLRSALLTYYRRIEDVCNFILLRNVERHSFKTIR